MRKLYLATAAALLTAPAHASVIFQLSNVVASGMEISLSLQVSDATAAAGFSFGGYQPYDGPYEPVDFFPIEALSFSVVSGGATFALTYGAERNDFAPLCGAPWECGYQPSFDILMLAAPGGTPTGSFFASDGYQSLTIDFASGVASGGFSTDNDFSPCLTQGACTFTASWGDPVAAPEPATVGLLLVGIAGALVRRRKGDRVKESAADREPDNSASATFRAAHAKCRRSFGDTTLIPFGCCLVSTFRLR